MSDVPLDCPFCGTHVPAGRVFRKTGMTNRVQLAVWAVKRAACEPHLRKGSDVSKSKDPFDDDGLREWLERAQREMFPKMKSSAMSMVLLDQDPDPKLCLEVGAAVLFNKPILVLAIAGIPVPPMLRHLAADVVEVQDIASPENKAKVQKALETILREPA